MNNEKHPFLSQDELDLILERLKKKQKSLESDIAALEPTTTIPEREKAGSEDGGSYQAAIDSMKRNKALLEIDKQKLQICNESIDLLENSPSAFGFNPKDGKPFAKEYLLRLLFISNQKSITPKKIL